MPMRRSDVHDASARTAGAVYLPLSRVPPAVELGVRHLSHLPQVPAARNRAAQLLYVSEPPARHLTSFLPQETNFQGPFQAADGIRPYALLVSPGWSAACFPVQGTQQLYNRAEDIGDVVIQLN